MFPLTVELPWFALLQERPIHPATKGYLFVLYFYFIPERAHSQHKLDFGSGKVPWRIEKEGPVNVSFRAKSIRVKMNPAR